MLFGSVFDLYEIFPPLVCQTADCKLYINQTAGIAFGFLTISAIPASNGLALGYYNVYLAPFF